MERPKETEAGSIVALCYEAKDVIEADDRLAQMAEAPSISEHLPDNMLRRPTVCA